MDDDSHLRSRASSVRATVRAALGSRATDDESESDAANAPARDDARSDGGGPPSAAVESGAGESPSADDDATAPAGSNAAALDGLDDFTAAIERCIDGDLTVRVDVPDDPALARHARALNELFEEWQTAMRTVDAFADQVSASTRIVADAAEESREESRSVAGSVDDIAAGARRQSESVEEVADEMRNLSATIEEVAASADEIRHATDEAVARGDRGKRAAETAIDELAAIGERTDATVGRVEELDDRIDDITGIATKISDIAEQTNILALNASIEAARAGEAGSGFAVVADEVKALAEETQAATADIESTIEAVRAQSAATVDDITDTSERLDEGSETIQDALSALDGVVSDLEETNGSLHEISDATDSQAATSQEVVSQADGVGEISDETAALAVDAAGSARRQTVSLSEAVTKIGALSDQADHLQDSIDDYRLHAEATESGQTVVQFWHGMSGDKAEVLESLVDEFNADHDGVRVDTASKGSYRGTFDATLAAARSGTPPTIAQLYEVGTQRALDSGAFTPVESVLPDGASAGELVPEIANYYRHDGALWSMPFNASNPVLYYNADAFERAGLDPDDPPATFDEVTSAAATLKTSGNVDYGATWANYSWFVEQWFAAAGECLFDADNGRSGTARTSHLDGPVGMRVFEWWRDLERNDLLFDPGVEARRDAREAFLDGRAAMLVDSSSSAASVVRGAAERGFTAEVGRFPAPGSSREGVVVGGASLWVADGVESRKRAAAGEFIAWLTRPEQQRRWHRQTGYFPVHRRTRDLLRDDGWFDEHPGFAVAFDQLAETVDTPATRGARVGPFTTVRTIVSEGLSELFDGRDLDAVLATMDEQVSARLSEYENSANR
ncbi:methyl-accepting chemotaxis protein [Haloferax denitrificans]|uniref:Transducer protein Htr38 n=1 Tax=Haloferax denitrificans ATCC 35960 TaxID=662478 RepID=M0J922_9EURY|nr:extracellular solute-binding protein [Haloferax denitrificans]EMA05476.1 transducer protein Htr38 [Haloferax denitrificans ATCC 35960]